MPFLWTNVWLPDIPSTSQYAARYNKILKENIQKILEAVIPVPDLPHWSFLVLIPTKKDGKPEFCVDYRALNQGTLAGCWQLSKIEETLEKLKENTVFTTLDVFSKYWKMKKKTNYKETTTFVTHFWTYQFKVNPSQPFTPPATLQAVRDKILKCILFSRAYLHDAVLYQKAIDEYLQYLQKHFLCYLGNKT